MKLAVLTGSISRLAGGTFTSIKPPVQLLQKKISEPIGVFGLRDANTDEDLPSWQPLVPQAFPTFGPKSFGFAPGYYDAVERYRPEIMQIHGIWMHFSLVGLKIGKKLNIPYIVNPHGMLDAWAVNNSSWKKRIAAFFYENDHLKTAACLRALCESEAVSMRNYGLKQPICTIPNGVDLPDGPITASPPWQDTVETGKKILLFLSRIHEKKGLKNLLEAWGKIQLTERRAASEWTLVIAGWDTTGHQEELLRIVADLRLQGSVKFVGPQFDEQKDAAYFHADAFVLPSYSEGLPMTVLEAWAFGLPVIMTPECNLPEGFAAQAAIRVATDPAAIVEGLWVLFGMTDAERKDMGRHGQLLVKEKYTWETITDEMYRVNLWLLGGGSRPDSIV